MLQTTRPEFLKTDAVIISETDPFGTILHVNDHFCEISGYSRQELEGSPHNIIRHPSMPKELFASLWATLKKEDVFRGIILNKTKDGREYWVNATIMPVFEQGQVTRYISARHLINDEKYAKELFKREAQKFGWPDFKY